jgi:hypothetical protein
LNDFMQIVLAVSPLLAVLAIVWVQSLRKLNCPDCGTRLPLISDPRTKTSHQWRYGGMVCKQCGCETDIRGMKLQPGEVSASDKAALPKICLALALAVAIAIPLTISLFSTNRSVPNPALVAQPLPNQK